MQDLRGRMSKAMRRALCLEHVRIPFFSAMHKHLVTCTTVLLLYGISAPASPDEVGNTVARVTAAERLRRRVAAIEAPLYDKCSKESEVCGGTPEEKARAGESILHLLIDRFNTSASPDELVAISDLASSLAILWTDQQIKDSETLSFNAATKAVRLGHSNAAANMAFAMALWQKAQREMTDERTTQLKQSQPTGPPDGWFDRPRETRQPVFSQAERFAKRAIELSQRPTCLYYANLAAIQDELTGRDAVALDAGRHALAAAIRDSDEPCRVTVLRSLWPAALHLNHVSEGKRYFEELAALRPPAASDWFIYAFNLADASSHPLAGDAYAHAANLSDDNQKAHYLSLSAEQFSMAEKLDDALTTARRALDFPSDDATRAMACRIISGILDYRGVYDEALRYADEAVALETGNHLTHFARASALYHLGRFADSLIEATTAIRLADGKYSFEHFLLGSIYFDMRSWEAASSAFQHAADIDKTDSSATYNLALCYENQQYSSDAADWYEETLRRNPKHAKRQQIMKAIARLRAK